MPKYIEQEAAIEILNIAYPLGMDEAAYDTMHSMISKLPAADVVEVRHGKWIDMGDFISCSLCNATRMKEFLCDYGVARRLDVRTNYCPNCGAKMDGGVNDGT